MKKLVLVILSVITLVGHLRAGDIEPVISSEPSQILTAISSNFYNKKVDYNWYGWQTFEGDIVLGKGYVILPDGKGHFQLNTEPIEMDEYAERKFTSYTAVNEQGEECKISITCFIDGNCIIAVCFDQKSWAYKCAEPITFNFKPSHVDW